VSEIELEELAARLDQVVLVDVRAPAEYDGTGGAPCDPRQGHIPGARNVPLEDLLTLGDAELRARLGLEAGSEVIVYCHSGGRSALAAQRLLLAGLTARNYTGSWHEWSRTELPAVLVDDTAGS
jgi:thiosulfate/3-mercaptopyruvate sulfurtransferase